MNMAVVNAYFELAAVLLDRGADPNAPDPRGSALHTLAFLRKPGADGAAGVGNTPKGPPPPTGSLSAIQLAKRLLEPAPIRTSVSTGRSARSPRKAARCGIRP